MFRKAQIGQFYSARKFKFSNGVGETSIHVGQQTEKLLSNAIYISVSIANWYRTRRANLI